MSAAGAPEDSEGVGYFLGSLLFPTLLGALAAWLFARGSSTRWPFWRLALVALPFFLLVRLLSVAGQAAG